jgi:hypothetical protein
MYLATNLLGMHDTFKEFNSRKGSLILIRIYTYGLQRTDNAYSKSFGKIPEMPSEFILIPCVPLSDI